MSAFECHDTTNQGGSVMAKKKRFPKQGIPKLGVLPDGRAAKELDLPKGFNRFGSPITCGVKTEWGGECGAYTYGLAKCPRHAGIE